MTIEKEIRDRAAKAQNKLSLLSFYANFHRIRLEQLVFWADFPEIRSMSISSVDDNGDECPRYISELEWTNESSQENFFIRFSLPCYFASVSVDKLWDHLDLPYFSKGDYCHSSPDDLPCFSDKDCRYTRPDNLEEELAKATNLRDLCGLEIESI